ncbi:unnamed protein product [Moneuplotes crassus]|uniref:Uncharacterized protein n=1 Tax=Euplotes crassus TaxID=5936 RepID=A0AAD1U3Q0_EUPCR|nr:unnamed protein product [Moneuplotes crassus]
MHSKPLSLVCILIKIVDQLSLRKIIIYLGLVFPTEPRYDCGVQIYYLNKNIHNAELKFPPSDTTKECWYSVSYNTEIFDGIIFTINPAIGSSIELYLKTGSKAYTLLSGGLHSETLRYSTKDIREKKNVKEDIPISFLVVPKILQHGKGSVQLRAIEKYNMVHPLEPNQLRCIIFGLESLLCLLDDDLELLHTLKYISKNSEGMWSYSNSDSNSKIKVHPEVACIRNSIQRQDLEVGYQNVSFEQIARYNNYLVYKDDNMSPHNDRSSHKAARGSHDKVHIGTIIPITKFKKSRRELKDLQMLNNIGLIDLGQFPSKVIPRKHHQ